MAEPTENAPKVSLESGTYEVIRGRLQAQAKDLSERLQRLNAARKEVFGSVNFELLATERVSTSNNCVPRDMVPIGGNRFLFGYNVQMGLRSETRMDDVFAIYEYRDRAFHEAPLDVLGSGEFPSDFRELYKYYRQTFLSRFQWMPPWMYMVFQIGKTVTDIKGFKWDISRDPVTYVGNRFDHEVVFPPQHQFEWKRAHRDLHRSGLHPHISIEDRVFVETVGGDLTIKVEDNTASGEGIYSEPVDNKDQTLDDAEIHYAIIGNLVILKIRPFQEEKYRYLVYSEKVKKVRRVDQIEASCVLLPDGQGIIFQNGYQLQTGGFKTFETAQSEMLFVRRLDAPNGENFLYVFLNRETGTYTLLSYNRIEQEVATPIVCCGFSIFDSGEMVCFHCDDEPRKHHALQIWQTPYLGPNVVVEGKKDAFLYKLGNPSIVSCMSECHDILKLLTREDTYDNLYVDLVKQSEEVVNAYFWLGDEKAHNLREVLTKVAETARSAIEEFDKVSRLRKNATQEIARCRAKVAELLRKIDYHSLTDINIFVGHLSGLRAVRGEAISLKEVRYVDPAEVEAMEKEVGGHIERLSALCVEFLLKPEALEPYQAKVEGQRAAVDKLAKVTEAVTLEEELAASSKELEMLVEIVSNLKISDSTQTTRIIDGISTIYASLNQVKAALKNRKKDLMVREGAAQFGAQLKLLDQAMANFLELCDSVKQCDEYLTRLMVQVEELEGHFADFDEYIQQLAVKREEIYNALNSRKLQITEQRNKRANGLMAAAERILTGIRNRAESFKTLNDINGYFASDLMVDKIRDVVAQLTALEDTIKAEDIQGRLKTIQQNSIRQLKDRLELFVDGQNVIQFGNHKFAVNTQPLDLAIVPRENEMVFHLGGTNFFEKVTDPEFLSTKDAWGQELVSEDANVYRAEHLAFLVIEDLAEGKTTPLDKAITFSDEERVEFVRQFMATRYTEGYVKGVHDADAAAILKPVASMHATIGLLRHHPRARAGARRFWNDMDAAVKKIFEGKLKSFGTMKRLFLRQQAQQAYIAELRQLLAEWAAKDEWFPDDMLDDAAEYLFRQFSTQEGWVISHEASLLCHGFASLLREKRFADNFAAARKSVAADRNAEFGVVRDWVGAYLSENPSHDPEYLDEASLLVVMGASDLPAQVDVSVSAVIEGMKGTHACLKDGKYSLNYHSFMRRLRLFRATVVPLFEKYTGIKKRLIDQKRATLRLEDFKPKVLTSFIRNKLVDQFYLPLVGSNLAKQIGAAGDDKRTDRMGLLLLVSPPGYGKTTLVEYVANRLGLIFMKINGPALGHKVTSLDPAEAPNAAAREEINRLNLALEMGDNVMICLDDIQHSNPELLQKFISLCDATRKIEGVYQGTPRTFDLRGRKVAVVMAGNPYTESGEKFKIPDMLANRADTYNLGDIVGNNYDVFKASYLENAVTSNRILQRLANRSQKDVQAIIKMAETGSGEGVEFEGNYAPEEITEMVGVMKSLLRIRDVVMRVNEEYIRSAAQADAYRTEPPFKLQGSYRNMNRLAEKVLPVMNEAEIEELINNHYRNEAQTLTTGAESNLIKFKELCGTPTDEEKRRWAEITTTYKRKQLYADADPNDPVGKVVVQLSTFREGLEAIKHTLEEGMTRQAGARQMEVTPSVQTIEVINQLLEKWAAIAEASRSAASSDVAPAHNVEVRYEVPVTFTNIIQNQFQLMQGWLSTLSDVERYQGAQIEALRGSITNLLESYKALMDEAGEKHAAKSRKKLKDS